MYSKIDKLRTLVNHPNTPRFEREAAARILNQLNKVKREVKAYKWTEFKESRVEAKV